MIRLIKIIFILMGISCFCSFLQPAFAKNRVLTDVKVIHASTGPRHVDPSLNRIIPELKSVFKYTSYKLIKDQRLNLGFNERGRVVLPGKRVLVVMPVNMEGKRIQYQINIQKNKQSVFQTRVLLKNNSSITIGGPQFNNGVLLFNISGSMR
jgi:hypothetical protein